MIAVHAPALRRGMNTDERPICQKSCRWFNDAVKVYGSGENKKDLAQLFGLKTGRGLPMVQDRRNKMLEKLLIALLRETESPTRKTRQGEPARPTFIRRMMYLSSTATKPCWS